MHFHHQPTVTRSLLGGFFAAALLWMALPTHPARAAEPQAPTAVVAPTRPADPYVVRVEALLEVERQELLTLGARLASAQDPTLALALQDAIEATKLRTRCDVLKVQIDWAKANSLSEQLTSLEKSLVLLEEHIAAKSAQPTAEN